MIFSTKQATSFFVFIAVLFFIQSAEAQFLKKLKKKAAKAAEEAVIRKTEEKVNKETSKTMDTIYGNKNGKNSKPTNNSSKSSNTKNENDVLKKEGIKIYSKFDFVPGEKLLFFDDFSNDFVGDFPSKWNTNAGGELVVINNTSNKWLKILPGYGSSYIPDFPKLPEEFTLEFDIIADGLSNKTSSTSRLRISITDNNTFEDTKNFAMVEIPFCQYIAQGIVVENKVNGKREIRNDIATDVRNVIVNKTHVSIAVNKLRVRLWLNQKKYVDVPRLMPASVQMEAIKLHLRGIDINRENIYISNVKLAEGGVDLRRQLINEGKFSTNGILFDSGSDKIQPQSYGIIRQISQALLQEDAMKIKIVGHTDAEGSDEGNLILSKKRAEAVKNALIEIYNISDDRLQTEGKGEAAPIADNKTVEGKARNRRVEFIKI